MSTNRQQARLSSEGEPLKFSDDEGEALVELLEELDAINQDPDKSPLNKYSMDDNNGGRIEFMKTAGAKAASRFLLETSDLCPR